MTRLFVHVEGVTEETFVNDLLAPFLYGHGFSRISARLIGKARQRGRRGGIRPWSTVRREIVNHLKEDKACIATTMVDYYGLPQTGSRAWPGRSEASQFPFSQKAMTVEGAMAEDIVQDMGSSFDHQRFIPYVVMHEFEALLFSDCDGFARGAGRPNLAPKLWKIRDKIASPEEIDDLPETAPSRRVEALIPGYQKPLMGNLAALEIGLSKIRENCPHFRDWLDRLCVAHL